MLLLRHNSSLPDLDASSFRLRSSSYPSYNTIPSKQYTTSPSEEILSNYDQRDNSLVDPWLSTPASAGVSQPADSASHTISRSTYSSPHPSSTSLDDPTRHARFLHTASGSSSARQSFSSHQPPVSLNRHLSEPNIRAVTQQSGHNYPLPTVTEQRYQQERRQHHSFQHGVLPSPSSATFSVDRRPSTAGSAASSGWDRRDVRAEPLQEVAPVQDLPPITSGYHHTSPDSRYPPTFSNPFNDNIGDGRPRSSGFGADPIHPPESTQSRLVPIARSVASEEEHDSSPPDPSVSKTYSFVSLPGNAVRKRPRRRYDEIERLYHCSWTGCTKSYGTLNHLNAHIVMQRHGNKRTPAEFKELRKQWRKAKKDETERMARLDVTEDRYKIGSEHATMQYPSQPYERQHRSYSYGRPPLYGPGVPGPEMEHQSVVGDAPARYSLSTETSSMRPQPIQTQYGYPVSSAPHSLYPATPISPTWPEQSTQYEGSTPPHPGPAPGHSHLPSQAVYEYERERQSQSWTSPSHATSSRPVPSYEVSPSYAQPPDSTLLTPLPGYQQSTTLETEYEEEYDSKQHFWTEQQH
ncbi:hypothetical protein EDB87DRAFT_1650846 [Lactarius vividus]|nr:hypothetical protein EDB87DRAFT_1650846 [Lactarius vividus]